MHKNYLFTKIQAHSLSLLVAALLVLTTLLLPGSSLPVMAQNIHPACLNDAGQAVVPAAAGGVGAWILVLNFNHTLSGSKTVGCRVEITGLGPLVVSRTLVECNLVNNTGHVKVGNGLAPFDGRFSISCPGMSQVKQTLENFTIWGRANFVNANAFYSIVQHQDVSFTANVTNAWHMNFDSRYGKSNFSSGDPATDLLGQVVSFSSAVRNLKGSHSLNQTELSPVTTIKSFEFNFDQPITISAPGPVWTLAEIIIDPPGGCCKG